MKQILKYARLFAILPLFVVALSPDYVGGVQAIQAANDSSVGHLSGARSYGSNTDVCGDRLCSIEEIKEKEAEVKDQNQTEEETSVEIFAISEIGENLYKAVFTVYNNSDEDIQKFQTLQVSSDSSSKDTLVSWISENSYTYVPVIIEATDPATISAELAN